MSAARPSISRAARGWARRVGAPLCALALAACNGILGIQEGVPLLDAAGADSGPVDAALDTTAPDSTASPDGAAPDSTSPDVSVEASTPADGAAPDASSPDVSSPDVSVDASPADAPGDGACDQTALHPPRAGCPDHKFACWTAPATSPGAANYSVLAICGDTVVIDKTTGLMWAQAEESGSYDWAAAHTACTSSRRAGFSDWRLPTRIELASLIDLGKTTQPAIETSAFPSTNMGPFWADSLFAYSTNNAWYVGYGHGYVYWAATSIKYYARCVR